jgi:hypothetical protein
LVLAPPDKGKSAVRRRRKATGLFLEVAGLPKAGMDDGATLQPNRCSETGYRCSEATFALFSAHPTRTLASGCCCHYYSPSRLCSTPMMLCVGHMLGWL